MGSFQKAIAAEHAYFANPIRGLMVWDAAVRAEKRDLALHDRELGVKLQQALQEQPAEHTIAGREAGVTLLASYGVCMPAVQLLRHPALQPGTCTAVCTARSAPGALEGH